MIDWREAHHWTRGYSDALFCKAPHPQDEQYSEAYHRGYTHGRKKQPCPA